MEVQAIAVEKLFAAAEEKFAELVTPLSSERSCDGRFTAS